MNKTARKVALINPENGSNTFYLNPLEMQRNAAAISRVPYIEVDLYDFRVARHFASYNNIAPDGYDLICLYTTSSSYEHVTRFIVNDLANYKSLILLFGEIPTDGAVEEFLRKVHRHEKDVIAFIGRNQHSFSEIITKYLNNEDISRTDNIAYIDIYGNYIESTTNLSPKISIENIEFDGAMLDECRAAGLQILVDGLTRGCEYHCGYCHLNNRRTTAGVVQDIVGDSVDLLVSLDRAIARRALYQFSDENFFGGRSNIEKTTRFARITNFSQRLSGRSFNGFIGIDTRADTVINFDDTADIAHLRHNAWQSMYDAGLRYAYLGIETLAPTQSKRYGKALDTKIIPEATKALKAMNINFTVGLIVLDPLTTVNEIQENISYIEKNNLYSVVASLLKEMRVQIKSPYFRILKAKVPQDQTKIDNYVYVNKQDIVYQDSTVATAIPFARQVHGLFSDSGYRHSDIAAYQTLDETGSTFLNIIPETVGRMECDVLKIALSPDIGSSEKDINISRVVRSTCLQVLAILNSVNSTSVLANYYSRTFNIILNRIDIHQDGILNKLPRSP